MAKSYEQQLIDLKKLSTDNWRTQLRRLEQDKKWDAAIAFMSEVIEKLPDDVDAAIFMNYLIMHLLVEEDFDLKKHDCYAALAKKYFDITYQRFSSNAEYLYYTAITAVMSEWYYNISVEDYQHMMEKAQHLDPANPVYKFMYYYELHKKDHNNKEAFEYATMVLSEDSPVKKLLLSKGACGEYIFGLRKHWSEAVVGIRPCYKH